MGEDKRFVFLGDWYEKLKDIEEEDKRNDFVWRIVEYGITGEFKPTGNGFIDGWLRGICDSIDRMTSSYQSKVEAGKNTGRQQLFDRGVLARMIAEGKKGKEIADFFGVDTSAIYHDKIWIDRKKNNYYRGLLEKSE